MNTRFIVSVVVVFVLSMLGGFLVHGMILHADYTALANAGVYRSPEAANPLMGYMMAANLVFAVAFTWIYRMGRQNRPWPGQGVRFGVAAWLLTRVPTYLIYYVVTPLGSDLVAKQIVLELFVVVAMGIAAAYINRDPVAAPARA